jgi:hypothetical protein
MAGGDDTITSTTPLLHRFLKIVTNLDTLLPGVRTSFTQKQEKKFDVLDFRNYVRPFKPKSDPNIGSEG